MTSFIPVTEESFDKVYNKMKAAFPLEERRNSFDEKNCLNDNKFKLFEIFDNENFMPKIKNPVKCRWKGVELQGLL